MLEQCSASDLLVRNHGNTDSVYDVRIIRRVVRSYVSSMLLYPTQRIYIVGKLVDGYLAMIARDEKLSIKQFQLLTEALPKDARYCDDNLYRAMDIYLKVRKSLPFL